MFVVIKHLEVKDSLDSKPTKADVKYLFLTLENEQDMMEK